MRKRVTLNSSSFSVSFKTFSMIVLLFCLGAFSFMIMQSFLFEKKCGSNRGAHSIHSFAEPMDDESCSCGKPCGKGKCGKCEEEEGEGKCGKGGKCGKCGKGGYKLRGRCGTRVSVQPVVIQSVVPNIPYNNLLPSVKDVLLNPYTPPLSDERYLVPSVVAIPYGAVPINMSSNGSVVDTAYRQVGILNPDGGRGRGRGQGQGQGQGQGHEGSILPLMGRPLYSRRDKWQYYTISNQHNNIKLPILVKGKSALIEYGVDALYDGDVVVIEGMDAAYKVSIYDSDTIRYLPAI